MRVKNLKQMSGMTRPVICICRVVYLPIAIVLGLLGLVVDFPVITVIAALKSPYMLFKGWHRLFQDCVGREGPFLETICVPFAGLAILLWPLAVAGAVLCSMVSGIVLGLYAAVIVYQVIITNLISSLDLKSQNCIFFHHFCRSKMPLSSMRFGQFCDFRPLFFRIWIQKV
ncbi:putative uncharacterized membrane protein [Helianthus annuus]|nr:putative uncharacterized membrane protein [Helianthus annuus]